jgi:predicted AlkP superfamily pyrophosphatase or phosphodiesterase
MPRPRHLSMLLLALSLAGCSGAPSAQPPGRPVKGNARPHRVILISLDGAGTTTLHDLYQRGLLKKGGFERFFREGEVADALIPVDPTLTSTSHISLATGFPPSATGIVGNQFHPGGSPFMDKANGFDAPIGTETLWEAVHRQGRRAGVLTWPGANSRGERRTADLGLVYNNHSSNSEIGPLIVTFERSDWQPAPPGPEREGLVSHSPLLAAHVALGPEGKGAPPPTLELFAVDGTDDGKVDYDSVAVISQPAGGVRRATPPMHVGEWKHVAWPLPDGSGFSWLKLLAVAPDLSKALLSLDGIYQTQAYPGDFAAALTRHELNWPGAPDSGSLVESWHGKPGIDLKTWSEEAERTTAFLGEAMRLAAARTDWDLLMGYIPTIDFSGHRLLLLDSRQPDFSPQRRDELARARTEAWQGVDAELEKLLAGLDLKSTTVVVVSDHGMTPVHTAIDPNALLAELGLLAKETKTGSSAAMPAAYAVTDGGAAHIYLDTGGDAQAGERILGNLAGRYADWRVQGEAPVEKVFTRREAAQIGLDSPNSGDLILFAREGYMFRNLPGGKPSAPAQIYGAHGYLNTHPDMQAIYMAVGAGVKPGRGGTVQATDVAPRVAAWLGIEPPARKPRE